MSEVNFNITASEKAERYQQFLEQVKPCIEGETYEVSLLANVSAALKEVFGFFWVGFYLVKDNQLILGPFQGSMACSIIKFGKGVCGTAWKENLTQVVPDVNQFPGHIACSSLSRSEIVVPMAVKGDVKGVGQLPFAGRNYRSQSDKRRHKRRKKQPWNHSFRAGFVGFLLDCSDSAQKRHQDRRRRQVFSDDRIRKAQGVSFKVKGRV